MKNSEREKIYQTNRDGKRILQHSVKRRILKKILELGGAKVSDLETIVGLPEKSVKKHLTSLKKVGLVKTSEYREGGKLYQPTEVAEDKLMEALMRENRTTCNPFSQ